MFVVGDFVYCDLFGKKVVSVVKGKENGFLNIKLIGQSSMHTFEKQQCRKISDDQVERVVLEAAKEALRGLLYDLMESFESVDAEKIMSTIILFNRLKNIVWDEAVNHG